MLSRFRDKLVEQVDAVFGARYYNSEDSGGPGVAANDLGMPDDVYKDFAATDPDFADIMSEDDDSGDQDDNGDGDNDSSLGDDNESDDDDSGNGDSSEEDDDDKGDDGEDGDPDDDEDSTDDDGDDDDDEGTSETYRDNVIDGISGEEFEKLPENVQVALAKHLDSVDEVKGKSEQVQTKLDQLLADPIVKERAQMIEDGRSDYQVRGLTDKEIGTIKDSLGLDDEEVGKLKGVVEAVAKSMADDMANNRIVEADNRRRREETISSGRKALLEAVSINPKLALKETDPSKLFKENGSLNEQHPEYAKAKDGLGKLFEYCRDRGLNYQMILKAKPQEIYASFAAANGLPVAFNTAERDRKMLASDREKVLSRFYKPNLNKSSPKFGKSSQSPLGKSGKKIGGYDIERLATDDDYYEKALVKKFGDPDHADKIEELRLKGEASLRKKKR